MPVQYALRWPKIYEVAILYHYSRPPARTSRTTPPLRWRVGPFTLRTGADRAVTAMANCCSQHYARTLSLVNEAEELATSTIARPLEGRTRRLPTPPRRRGRGRPVGGGNTAEQTREILLDAAERSFTVRGYRASTMEVIAQDAGYSRAAIYRQFPNRELLVDALTQRTTQRHMVRMLERQPQGIGPIDMIVATLVIVATELAHDPLLKTISEASDEGTIAHMLANSTTVRQLAERAIEAVLREDAGKLFRRDIDAQDLTQYLVATALSLLLGIIPGSEDAEVARRYIDVFVLPAIVRDPPQPRAVFPRQT
jgi:AcrR family transcriptional regulator